MEVIGAVLSVAVAVDSAAAQGGMWDDDPVLVVAVFRRLAVLLVIPLEADLVVSFSLSCCFRRQL